MYNIPVRNLNAKNKINNIEGCMITMFAVSSLVGCLLKPIAVPPRLLQWEPIVRMEACRHGVNPKLVLAIIDVESAGKWKAKNGIAMGLMQIKVTTARALGYYGSKLALLNPVVNIHYGVKYLVKLASRYKYGWDVVSAYNCGRPHWRRGLGFMCLGRKTDYVKKVVERFRRLKERKKRTHESFRMAEYHPFFGVVPQE